jgi:CRISPR-associated protein Cst2
MTTPIYSLALAIKATLDMHDLNNEGSEGNQIMTRMVDIIDLNGELCNVNALSGDMLKHIQAEHFFRLAVQRGLPLCAGCQQFNPNRINADQAFIAHTKAEKMSDADTLDALLQTCAMDDVEGILITEGGRSIPRKSVVEFGWAVGLPQTSDAHNQSFFHVKYAPERSDEKREKDAASRVKKGSQENESQEKTGGGNLGQAIFHRPASSGQYAIVCHIEFSRIGYNDIRQQYALSLEERTRRGAVLLESLLHTFVQLNGAMRSAQLPHLVRLEGALAYSTTMLPAPLISPLADDYVDQMQRIGTALGSGSITVAAFDSLGQLAEQVQDLVASAQPYMVQRTQE